MKRLRTALSPANVLAAIAVFLVLGGTAFAVKQVGKNSVSSKSIKDSAVTGRDVKDNSLTGADVNEGTLALPADQTAPTGPAGGGLAGTFPNPAIGADAVGPAQIATDGVTNTDIATGAVTGIKLGLSSVDSSKIQDDAVGAAEIQDDSVRAAEISPEEVTQSEIRANAVGSSELGGGVVGGANLKGLFTVTTAGVPVTTASAAQQRAACPQGSRIVSGGFSWQENEPNSILASRPDESDPDRVWFVRGMVESGSNVLFAWANCLTQ